MTDKTTLNLCIHSRGLNRAKTNRNLNFGRFRISFGFKIRLLVLLGSWFGQDTSNSSMYHIEWSSNTVLVLKIAKGFQKQISASDHNVCSFVFVSRRWCLSLYRIIVIIKVLLVKCSKEIIFTANSTKKRSVGGSKEMRKQVDRWK